MAPHAGPPLSRMSVAFLVLVAVQITEFLVLLHGYDRGHAFCVQVIVFERSFFGFVLPCLKCFLLYKFYTHTHTDNCRRTAFPAMLSTKSKDASHV